LVEPTDELGGRLVQTAPDGILVSRGNRLVFVNPAAARLFGASSPEALLGTSPATLFHPDDEPVIRASIERTIDDRSASRVDAIAIRPDGTTIDVEIALAFVDGPADRTVQLAVRDVTARRRAEAALRESEERLRLAFAGAQEGVWDWNLRSGAVVYSTRWKQMLGYADDEVEPHVGAWERLLHPEDRVRAEELSASLARGAQTYEGEFRLRHKDGHFVHVLSRGFPVREQPDGPVVRIVGMHLDITDRKRAEAALRESEERLRLAFAGAQEGVWDWNLETGAVVYSTYWKQMLGYGPDEIEPHVGAWERLLHPDDRQRAEQLNESLARGATTYEGEFRLRHKAGHFVHVLSRGFPVRREPGGPVIRIVGTHFDLTERRRAEAERTHTELLARLVFAQEDERRRIAREMHDQFGEQLTALSHRIAALRDGCRDTPDLAEKVQALERVAERIDRDVDHLVWELRPTALDDLGLQAALANYLRDWSARVNIAAELHASGLTERLASEIETTLYRIAQEAMTNVARHAGASRVDVILQRQQDSVMLVVEDDGVGFDPADPTKGRHGFGLLGMQERASLVGATIQIESAPGRGTTILVRIAPAGRTDVDG
jgi:PAS domain S-box-containing protein